LMESPKFKEIIAGKNLKITMGTDFVLHIQMVEKAIPQEV
jgi:hypothetical protein